MRAPLLLILPALLFVPRPVRAEPQGSVYRVDPLIDGVGTAAMIGIAILIDSEKARWNGLTPCGREGRSPTAEERAAFERLGEEEGLCENDSVSVFERFVSDLGSPSARLGSDLAVLTLALAPYGYAVADVFTTGADRPGLRFGEDALIAAETQGATLLATNLLKLMVKRPRPYTYSGRHPKLERFGGDARLSFPSGHTSLAFASASLIAFSAAARHGNAPITWVSGSVAYLTAGLVAYLRVQGGKHYLTDVFAGAVLGIAAGLTIPAFHARSASSGESADPMMLSIGGVF